MKFKSEYHRKHYEAWMLQSEHPEWERKKFKNPLFSESGCYACDEAWYIRRRIIQKTFYSYNNKRRCLYCPIDWGTRVCMDKGSVFMNWCHEKDPKKSSELCVIIANMEWRIKNE